MVKIAPSILAADFSHLGEDVLAAVRGGAKYMHIDVMDGAFVPNMSIGPCVIQSLRPVTDAVFDVHLMIDRPERYVEDFAKAGADIITVHIEATQDLDACIDKIKALGVKAGVSIKPATPVEAIAPYLDKLDMVLVMSVEPGFGGQKYMPSAEEKLRKLKALAPEGMDISVDGGINLENITRVVENGANTVVAGSAIFGQPDIEATTRKFVETANQ
ncbi:MAG: ribulose-phosphate 3-epimerase [Clostridia bacterium]|nr:ribulose-phosphate 3-epimerase [Clostridia bacterium]